MKRYAILFTLSLLLIGSVMLSAVLPVQAEGPGKPPKTPYHRVGHRAKAQNLDVLLDQNVLSDPLAGNYRLIKDDDIVFAMGKPTKAVDSAFSWQAYDVTDDLSDFDLIPTGKVTYTFGTKPVVATGHFSASDPDAYVLIWEDEHDEVSLIVDQYYMPTGETGRGPFPPQVATGDFDGDGLDEIVIAWYDSRNRANLKVYDVQHGYLPVAKDSIRAAQVAFGGNLDIATGDFDGDGDDEIALAWTDEDDRPSVKIYDVTQDGSLSARDKWHSTYNATSLVAVSTGDLNGDGRDEIVLSGNHLRVFQVSADMTSITQTDRENGCLFASDAEQNNWDVVPMDVATGDFNLDGQDEIVTTCHALSDWRVAVWAADSDLKLHSKATWHRGMTDGWFTYTGSLAVGDVNHDLRSEIIVGRVAWNGMVDQLPPPSAQHNYIYVLQVSDDLKSIQYKSKLEFRDIPPMSHFSVALGDLNDNSIRVGPPTYSLVSDDKEILAVINEPPKHVDVLDGETYNVNNNPSTYARYEDSHSQSTEMSLMTTRDWGLSTGLEAEAAGINASLKTSYGEHFENTTSSFREMAFGQNAWASGDDVIIRTETDYDVWEYPVYTDDSDTIQGHIVVVFPRKRDPNCTANCVSSIVTRIDGKNPASYYLPDHENGNLLSYSSAGPDDIGTLIKADNRNYLGINPYELWVTWSDVESDASKKSKQLDVSIGAGVEAGGAGWGIKANVEGTYGRGQVSTHTVSFKNTTSIHTFFDSIDPRYSYWVEPYIYWSSTDGHLVVDYAAGPLTATPSTWWQNTYTQPDPTFNLPWKYNNPPDAYNALSKEITFDPPSPKAGDMVTITAKVRNYSLVGAYNVKVRFYLGDPDEGGAQISHDLTIPQLNPLSSQTIELPFDTTGHDGETLRIYAVIDPDHEIDEMHEDYNKAYALLPVRPGGVSVVPSMNLSITSGDISFDPPVPALGETVHITASVKAQGIAFTHVAVEFWDGAPDMGGHIIGGEVIPMILAGESGAAHVIWQSNGAYGLHNIWVRVEYQAGKENLDADNQAHRPIFLLAPHQYYLPLWQESPEMLY